MDASNLHGRSEHASARRRTVSRERARVQALVEGHLRLVVALARSLRGYGLEHEELVAAGNVGLVRAATRFQPRGIPFHHYARYFIRSAMFEVVMRSRSITAQRSDLPSKRFFVVRNELARLSALHGADSERVMRGLARRLDVSEEEAAQMVMHVHRADESLDVPLYEDSEEPRVVGLMAHAEEDAETRVQRLQVRHRVREALARQRSRFDEREWSTLTRRLLGEPPATLDEIAREFGLTRERIRQIEAGVLRRLRYLLPRELAA